MRMIVALALMAGIAAPAAGQTSDAALGRVADALRQEGRMLYLAGAIRTCNLRDPVWIGRFIQRTQRQSTAAYEAELARIPPSQRSGFERDAWIMQAEARSWLNRFSFGTRQTAMSCAELRQEGAGISALDRMVAGH